MAKYHIFLQELDKFGTYDFISFFNECELEPVSLF